MRLNLLTLFVLPVLVWFLSADASAKDGTEESLNKINSILKMAKQSSIDKRVYEMLDKEIAIACSGLDHKSENGLVAISVQCDFENTTAMFEGDDPVFVAKEVSRLIRNLDAGMIEFTAMNSPDMKTASLSFNTQMAFSSSEKSDPDCDNEPVTVTESVGDVNGSEIMVSRIDYGCVPNADCLTKHGVEEEDLEWEAVPEGEVGHGYYQCQVCRFFKNALGFPVCACKK